MGDQKSLTQNRIGDTLKELTENAKRLVFIEKTSEVQALWDSICKDDFKILRDYQKMHRTEDYYPFGGTLSTAKFKIYLEWIKMYEKDIEKEHGLVFRPLFEHDYLLPAGTVKLYWVKPTDQIKTEFFYSPW
jgi:hypothetical protein